MKLTYNWLKDFVDIKVPAKKLAEKLTMAGLEVTSLEEKGNDFVFEFEITPNRPDLLSVIGIAREAAAITNKKFNVKSLMFNARNIKHSTLDIKQFSIKIEDKKDCPLYTARIIKGIQVKPSPDWLKKRLELVGLRSVNNIVDITNYVLLETGQPLHAFDFNKIKNDAIFVRRARESEKITLIDGREQNLTREILVIADKERPIAIAGIMGGQDSEVIQETRDILLEAAVFEPVTTRRASRRLGLSSESSYRFERGLDWQNVEFASMRAVNLILKLAGGKLVLSKSTIKPKVKKKTIILKTEEVNRVLGRDFTVSQIRKALISLCLIVKKQKTKDLNIDVPSFRIDISQPVDLIEEVARISGYENIPPRLPRVVPQDDEMSLIRGRRVIKDILIGQGVNEVITYSLINKSMSRQFGYPDSQLITIVNPLTSQQDVLRPRLIPGLISCIGYNLNQKQKDIRIFEIGNIFRVNQEQPYLGLAYSGKEFNLLSIKGILELLLERLGIVDFEFLKLDYEHPYFQKEISLSLMLNKKIFANLGMIKPDILKRLDIEDFIFAAELELDWLFAQIQKTQKRYVPIPLYPEVVRDISIMLKQDISVGDVIKKIKINRIPYLVDINLKDHYLGKQIPPGYKGLTLSCIYRAGDHTLTAQEIDASHQKILDILTAEFSAQQR
jgi:phenylalanyl-tRNA synthetase beta chain